MNKAAKQPPIEVKVGQLWIDNDRRYTTPRYVRVYAIEGKHALCVSMLRGEPETQRRVKIMLSRFRPNSTGYRLAPDQKAYLQDVTA